MTAHRCAGGLKKLDLRSGSQRHRHFVGKYKLMFSTLARLSTMPFFYAVKHFSCSFYWQFLLCLTKFLWVLICSFKLSQVSVLSSIWVTLFLLVKSLFMFQLLGECHWWWTSESPRAHVAKSYGRLRLIRSVVRASEFSVSKMIEIIIRGFITPSLLASACFLALFGHHFYIFETIPFFGNGSLTRVKYPKCAYGPYC